jgi:hypothetical protein
MLMLMFIINLQRQNLLKFVSQMSAKIHASSSFSYSKYINFVYGFTGLFIQRLNM